jgi:hypothetical protein
VPEIKKTTNGNIAVLDSTKNSEARSNYLSNFGIRPDLFLSREQLSGSASFGQKFLSFFLVTKVFSLCWLGCFSRNRADYALLMRESIEWFNLLSILKKNKIKEIYMFCIYEKDSNMLAYLLMKKGIKVNKITSEVPLTFANRIILTNKLILCFNYQKEEVEAYKKTIFFDEMETWFPEAQGAYLHLYNNKTFDIPQNTIGFYSSALWLRKKLNHSIADVGSYDAEEEVLKFLVDYIEERKNLKLIVFTHPYEKRTEENQKLSKTYYENLIGKNLADRIIVSGKETISTQSFQKVNVGVSLFSTIMFERLSLGFKTILTPIDKKDFPLQNSPFRNICAYSKEELFKKLDSNLSLGKEGFFKSNGINDYPNKSVNLNYKLN